MILLFDRLKNKLEKSYRCRVFRKKTGCACQGLQIGGKIHIINSNVTIGSHCLIMPGVQFFGDGPIVIGNNVSIGNNTMLYASKDGGIVIGDDTMIAADCYIIDSDHGMRAGTPMREQQNLVQSVKIGRDVWIAAGSKVLRGTQIGDGAVVGAMSLVKGTVEPNMIVCGIPAKPIKSRNDIL